MRTAIVYRVGKLVLGLSFAFWLCACQSRQSDKTASPPPPETTSPQTTLLHHEIGQAETVTTEPERLPQAAAGEETTSVGQAMSGPTYEERNLLSAAPSPYLRSLTSSPIHWHIWDKETLEAASALERPLLISIGVTWSRACREEDEATWGDEGLSAFVNKEFVPIKIDADQRPDLAERYKLFYAIVRGTSPSDALTIIAQPDGSPFEAVPMFSPENGESRATALLEYLRKIVAVWRDNRPEISSQVVKFEKVLQEFRHSLESRTTTSRESVKTVAHELAQKIFENAPPALGQSGEITPYLHLALLALQHYSDTRTTASLEKAQKIMSDLYRSAWRDHVFGGYFHALANDGATAGKLLSDQALALQAFSQLYAATSKKLYREAAEELLAFFYDTFENLEEGGFYSSQEIDRAPQDPSAYFTWSLAEIDSVLTEPAERQVFAKYYGLEGNDPSEKTHLAPKQTLQSVASSVRLDYDSAQKLLSSARSKLREHRYEQADFPRVNKSLVVSWNAKAISAYCDAYRYLGAEHAKEFALKTLKLLRTRASSEAGLCHYLVRGEIVEQPILLEDQIFMIQALLDCAEISGELQLVSAAQWIFDQIQSSMTLERTSLLGDWLSRDNSGVPQWLQPLPFLRDTLLESPNAASVVAVYQLYQIKGDDHWRDQALARLGWLGRDKNWWDRGLASWAKAALIAGYGPPKVVIVGSLDRTDTQQLQIAVLASFRLGKIVEVLSPEEAAKTDYAPSKDSKAVGYVCTAEACAPPTSDSKKLRATILDFGRE